MHVAIIITLIAITHKHRDHHQGGHGARAGVVGGAEEREVLQLHEEEEGCCTRGGEDDYGCWYGR